MSSPRKSHNKPHDVGGQDGGPLDVGEYEISHWERRIDAMVSLLRQKGVIADWAQLRYGVEALSEEDYRQLDYYERWASSAARIAVEQQLVSQQELDQRIEQLMSAGEAG